MELATTSDEVRACAAKVRLLALDCDGVLTDGRLYFGAEGESLKVFHVHDGKGIALWHDAGYETAVITARTSSMLIARAKELQISNVEQNASDKGKAIEDLARRLNIPLPEIAFVGDDLADISAMKIVGLPIAVRNALSEVKAVSSLVTSKNGGEGAVREVVEFLLAAK